MGILPHAPLPIAPRLNVVYVVTRSKITVTNGRDARVVVDGEWTPSSTL